MRRSPCTAQFVALRLKKSSKRDSRSRNSSCTRKISGFWQLRFGIQKHVDLGIKYNLGIDIYGMDFYVVLDRAGHRVARRRRAPGRVGPPHRVYREESVKVPTEV
ncbi:hypothetical protein V3C99_003812 [Haemonchus contortus]|uniref:Transposase n=1 Tax=Haemonchus contortus TaxID=6289 RepID=A0A7I4XYZ5_HAECO